MGLQEQYNVWDCKSSVKTRTESFVTTPLKTPTVVFAEESCSS